MVMALIYTIVGEYELALDELEIVLSIESWSSPKFFRADPIYAPIVELPRFLALEKKYNQEN